MLVSVGIGRRQLGHKLPVISQANVVRQCRISTSVIASIRNSFLSRFMPGMASKKEADHHHDHHPKKPIKEELDVNSPQYLKKYFGFLLEPANKPETVWPHVLFNNSLVLEAIAEINACEFKISPLNAKTLKAAYNEQLGNFVNVRKSALQAAGVSEVIIKVLEQIYEFRANVPQWELERTIKIFGFLGTRPNYRITRGDLEEYPLWRLAKGQGWNTSIFNTAFDPKLNFLSTSNEADIQFNIKLFRGARGFINAVMNGLTDAQRDHILAVLDKDAVSQADAKFIDETLQDIQEVVKTNPDKAMKLIEEARKNYRPGTAAWKYFSERIQTISHSTSEVAKLTTVTIPEHVRKLWNLPETVSYNPLTRKKPTPEEFRRRINKIVEKGLQHNPEHKKELEGLKAAVDYVLDPTIQKDLTIINRLATQQLTNLQRQELVSIFPDNADSDDLINDVMNPHPIAARLWGDRVQLLLRENTEYTREFAEGAETLYPHLDSSEYFQKDFKLAPKSPTPPNLPFNTAQEEIYHWKLERLATEFYHWDLQSDFGLARFDLFTQAYDLSPGENSLDRVHGYPPPHHTYEELPIIKFDGYDPLSEEGVKASLTTVKHH